VTRAGNLTEEGRQREERTRLFLDSETKRAIALRSKDREFHGLEREFRYHQEKMVADYDRSKDIKHPRDVGDAREEILRKFLTDSSLIPRRYCVPARRREWRRPLGISARRWTLSFMIAAIPLA
jgi:hypothetical protein